MNELILDKRNKMYNKIIPNVVREKMILFRTDCTSNSSKNEVDNSSQRVIDIIIKYLFKFKITKTQYNM